MAEKQTGIRRLALAMKYTLAGLKAAWRNEAAFRQETAALFVLAPLGIHLGQNGVERSLLVGSCLMVIVVELLNSAIEAAVDRFGPERHYLSKNAKDFGSAAVFVSITMVVLVWSFIIF